MIDKNNPLLVLDQAISEYSIKLLGNASSITTISVPKYSGG
jgi:hypothetical protein